MEDTYALIRYADRANRRRLPWGAPPRLPPFDDCGRLAVRVTAINLLSASPLVFEHWLVGSWVNKMLDNLGEAGMHRHRHAASNKKQQRIVPAAAVPGRAAAPKRADPIMLPAALEALNGAERGQTVFVIGASPQLNELSAKEIAILESLPTIGLNRTYLKFRPKYFLSAYVPEIIMASFHMDHGQMIHMKRIMDAPHDYAGITVCRQLYKESIGLPRYLSRPVPCLYTRRNAALAATHLAIVLGASRICYIGVDQSSYQYFWLIDEAAKEKFREDHNRLRDPKYSGAFSGFDREAYLATDAELLASDASERNSLNFKEDHSPMFRTYFDHARAYGIKIVSTIPSSVISRAGAADWPARRCIEEAGNSLRSNL